MKDLRKTWDLYTKSWGCQDLKERLSFFKLSLDDNCTYTDPLGKTKGWDELSAYMEGFQGQIPGGHFETIYFLAHNNNSISRWNMRNSKDEIISDGISYGEYNDNGKLVRMTGFFETP